MSGDEVNTRIISALETAPPTRIPTGFAARVAGQLPALPVTVPSDRYGNRAAVACLLALTGLMLMCAWKAPVTSVFWISLQWIFCIQFGLLSVWLVARNASYTFDSFISFF